MTWTKEQMRQGRAWMEEVPKSSVFGSWIPISPDYLSAALDEIERLQKENHALNHHIHLTNWNQPIYFDGREDAFLSLLASVKEVLDGKDDGRGIATPPWEPVRRRLLLLVAREAEWRKVVESLLKYEGAANDGINETCCNSRELKARLASLEEDFTAARKMMGESDEAAV